MGSVGSIRRFSEGVVGFEGDGSSTQVGFRIGGGDLGGLNKKFLGRSDDSVSWAWVEKLKVPTQPEANAISNPSLTPAKPLSKHRFALILACKNLWQMPPRTRT